MAAQAWAVFSCGLKNSQVRPKIGKILPIRMGVGSKDKRDVYYYKAKSMGYRARSAFKLLDIESTFGIFRGARNVVDLCAAPGSWSQVLSKIPGSKIVAIDVQEIAPVGCNVVILKEDITSARCLEAVRGIFRDGKADLVVCDGAPDVTGFHDLDEYLQVDLLKSSLAISLEIAQLGSTFVGKCFRGEYTGYLIQHFLRFYDTVDVLKPRSSRGASMECFLLCRGMKHSDHDPKCLDVDSPPANFEVKECGSGPDPDFTISEIGMSCDAKFQPIDPPYRKAIDLRRRGSDSDDKG